MSNLNVRKAVRLLPAQKKVIQSTKREILYSGGYGCNVFSTKLLTTEGEIAIGELCNDNKAPIVLTWTGKDFKWIQAEVPYLKSIEETLEIKTSNGRSIEVAYNHYFLTTKGWKAACEFVVGEQILGYSACPQHSNSDISAPSSYISPNLTTNIILEINKKSSQKIYDIGVPKTHNYVAHGLIHHNSGKTLILLYAAIRDAIIPNNRVLILRKTLTSLKKSTLNTLISGENPVLPNGSYTYNKSEGIIKLNNGGEIYLMGLDDAERIKSTEFGLICIDEASELSLEEFQIVKYRCRLGVGSRRMYLATNPSSQDHWLYKRFYLENNERREAISASSLENTYLPEDYIEEFKSLEGARYKRCVEGSWVNLDNQIFDTFDRQVHVRNIKKQKYEEYIVGIDYGYTHYTGMVVIGKTGTQLHVIEEFYKNKLLIRDIMEKVKYYQKLYNPTFIYDPSAAGLGAELENINLTCQKANNDVEMGIDRIRNKLKLINGNSELVISCNCPNLIREMENYQYKQGTEKPVKVNDDVCFIKGTKILTQNGYKNIEDIKINDSVYDGIMCNKVTNSISTGKKDVIMYRINNRFLICTENHPIFVNGVKIPIGELCRLFKQKKELLKKLNLKEGSTEDICITSITNTLPVEATGLIVEGMKEQSQGVYTGTYGKSKMAQFLKDTTYTIKISIIQTMILAIWNLLKKKHTVRFILKSFIKNIQNLLQNKLIKTKTNVEYGINQKKDISGIVNTQEKIEQVSCTGVIANLPVYNITVENSHRYFANNILVANCDSLRYAINYLDDIKGNYIYPTFNTENTHTEKDDEDEWQEVNQDVGF